MPRFVLPKALIFARACPWQAGKPTQNAFVESLNGKSRDECLNVHWFDDLTDAKEKMQAWQDDSQWLVAPAIQGPMGRTKVRKSLTSWT